MCLKFCSSTKNLHDNDNIFGTYIDFIVAMQSIAEHVNDDVLFEFILVLQGQLRCSNYFLRIPNEKYLKNRVEQFFQEGAIQKWRQHSTLGGRTPYPLADVIFGWPLKIFFFSRL